MPRGKGSKLWKIGFEGGGFEAGWFEAGWFEGGGFEEDGIEFSQLSRMSNNSKAAAKEVQKVCRNTRVKNGLQKLVNSNTSADRGKQWGQVKRQFMTNCDMAQRIVATPTPNSQLLSKIDLEYTKGIAERVLANSRNSSNELNKLKKERANLAAGLESIEDPSSLSPSSPVAENSTDPSGGRRRRRNKTNRKNRNRKTKKNRRNRN